MAYQSWSVVFGEQPSAAKWNILGTNDSSFNDGTGIAVSAITPEKLLTGTGTSWPWTSFTPSYTNVTTTSGTSTGFYKQIGKLVVVRTSFTFGASSAMGSNPNMTLPITSVSYGATTTSFIGQCYLQGALGPVRWVNTTTVDFAVWNASATYLAQNSVTATVPVTWTTGNVFTLNFFYEAA